MARASTTKTYTVIVVPDETSRVRRFQLPQEIFRRGIAVGGVVLLLLTVGLVDYVRLRVQVVDVNRLRAETELQQEEVESVNESLNALEAQMNRIQEFERKMRVIANLPAVAEPVGEAPEEEAEVPENTGQGGGVEAGDRSGTGASLVPPLAPALPRRVGAPVRKKLPQNELDRAALERVTSKAVRLAPLATARVASIEELTEQLQGKSRRLASTPSIWPARGWLTSRYGYRISPFTGKRQFHGGIDVAAGNGTEIVAPARGRVVFVGRKGPLGKAVVLDHGDGVRSTYGHTNSVDVELGDEVERGQRIATVGMSGRTTGPHLHYAVSVNDKSRDPMDYIFE
jgi:hypothetical protein